MATTVGQHSVSTFATPVNGGPLDANVVRGNDNTIRSAYVAHDADTGIHVQSSTLATRPAAGTVGRKWITADTGIFKLWYDDGTTWHEVGASTIDVYVLADENLVKGDIIKVTGYNVGNGAPRVAKVSSASDVAFGIVNGTIASGAVGYVTNTGLIIDLNTNSFAIGDILYPNTSGGLTTTKPTSGNYQPVAFVLRSNTNNGVLYVEFSAPRIVERSDNTASTVVLRDASGNFSAGTITAGALTSTGLVTFASLKGTGATTVTNIINDGTMATASATTLATSASIKTYVDTQIGANNDLSEVLANGNTTGANNIIVTNGQKITTNTIDETTAAAGVTIDSVLLKDNEVTATGVRVTNLKANDGTAAGSIANSTGVVTLGSSVLTTTDINGGTVDGTTIGASVPAAATFTNITSAGTINLTGATVSNGGSVTTIDINGGTIDGTTIGGASPAAGTFTTINATDINATTFDMTNLEVTNIKAKDGTASMTIADTTGNVTVSAALVANGNVTIGDATTDTITVGGAFVNGTKLRTGPTSLDTLAISAANGGTYTDFITLRAGNGGFVNPALTIIGPGTINSVDIGGTTPATGTFSTLTAKNGDFFVKDFVDVTKFSVASATGNTAISGTLTLGSDVVLSRGAADRLDLASGDSLNVVSGTYKIANTDVLSATTLGSGVTASSLTSVGTLTSLTVSGNTTLGAEVFRSADNSFMRIAGGNPSATGAALVLFGSTHATAPGRIDLNAVGTGTFNISTGGAARASIDASGNLAVDTNTLYVDAANNRVGVGTASPGSPLDVIRSSTSTTALNEPQIRAINTAAATLNQRVDIAMRWEDGTYNGTGGISMVRESATARSGSLVFSSINSSGDATQAMRLDASGNLGLGTTPSAWGSGRTALQIGNDNSYVVGSRNSVFGNNAFNDGSWKYITNYTAQLYVMPETGGHIWYTAPSGTSGNTISFTQAMTLDASGNLGVSTTTTSVSGGDFRNIVLAGVTTAAGGYYITQTSDGAVRGQLGIDGTVVYVGARTNHPLAFTTNNTERARITSGGYFKASDNGTYNDAAGVYHELKGSQGDRILLVQNASNSGPRGMQVQFPNASPDDNTSYFLQCNDSTTTRCYIWSDGDLANHDGVYGTISDERLKQDIVDAGSQWDDLKAVRFRKYRMKTDVAADPNAPYQLGVVAQELEQTSPGLVDEHPEYEEQEVTDEDGNVTTEKVQVGTTKTVKSSILLMKAAVALQEAMARIEALEARLEALEA